MRAQYMPPFTFYYFCVGFVHAPILTFAPIADIMYTVIVPAFGDIAEKGK